LKLLTALKKSRKLYMKIYMSLKWHRRDAATLSAAASRRSVMTGCGGGGGGSSDV